MTALPLGHGRRRATLVSAVCALVVTGTGLTGCGDDPDAGTNGVGKLTPQQIQSRTRKVAVAADAVRLSGSVVVKGRTYRLDMRLKANGGTGSVTSEGATFGLLRVDEHLFLKADASFWNHEDNSTSDAAAADKLDGKYVKVPQGDPAYQRLSGFTNKDVLLDGLLTLHGDLATGGRREQNGIRTIRLTGDKGSGGTLDIALQGSPYPVRLVRAGGAGTLRLTDWGRDFTLEEPPENETVDYGKQLPAS